MEIIDTKKTRSSTKILAESQFGKNASNDIQLAIKKIELRTKSEVIEILRRNRIKKNGKSDQDFNFAKSILFNGLLINPEVYNKQIRWILDYLQY